MILTPDMIAAALMSGAIIGLFLGTFGGGGSILAVPLLIYFVGVGDTHMAIGTSAASVAAIALFNLLGKARDGYVMWRPAALFAAAGMIGSFIGSSLAKTVDGQSLLLAFAGAMAVIGLSMLRKRKSEGTEDVTLTTPVITRLLGIGLIVGAAAGFFGIGGGFLIVPGLMFATGMALSYATASSLLSVTLFGTVTSLNYAASGLIDLRLTALLLAGGMVGGLGGIYLSRFIASHLAVGRKAFAGLIIMVAVFVAMKAL